MSSPKDQFEAQEHAQTFDNLPQGPIQPFDPSWDAGPRAQRTELTIAPLAPEPKDRFLDLLGAQFNESDAGALQRVLSNRWEDGVDLAFADLRRRDISELEDALRRSNLERADLSGARLIHTQLGYSNMRGAKLCGAVALEADFMGTDLRGADLSRANLTLAIFGGSILAEANLQDATLVSARMAGANLRGANLTKADLSGADLRGADLTGAEIRGATLYLTDFSGAVMPNGERYANSEDDETEDLLARYSA